MIKILQILCESFCISNINFSIGGILCRMCSHLIHCNFWHMLTKFFIMLILKLYLSHLGSVIKFMAPV